LLRLLAELRDPGEDLLGRDLQERLELGEARVDLAGDRRLRELRLPRELADPRLELRDAVRPVAAHPRAQHLRGGLLERAQVARAQSAPARVEQRGAAAREGRERHTAV